MHQIKGLLKRNLLRQIGFQYLQISCSTPKWSSGDWDFSKERGPAHWDKWYPSAKGRRQSPIALESDAPISDISLRAAGYNHPNKLQAVNNGKIAIFKPNLNHDKECTLIGAHGSLDKYHFDHFHFHWGSDSSHGCEHTIDGKRYPMEVHFVHCLNNESLAKAAVAQHGIAVLGFLFQISDEDNTALDPLIEAIKHITFADDSYDLPQVNSLTLRSLLPEKLDKGLLWYSGSLTTPPCTEVVQWQVFLNTIPISEQQMAVFRTMKSCDRASCTALHCPSLVNNYRPLQPLNGRLVYKSHKFTAE